MLLGNTKGSATIHPKLKWLSSTRQYDMVRFVSPLICIQLQMSSLDYKSTPTVI